MSDPIRNAKIQLILVFARQTPNARRFGYMGHVSLLAEEVVKLFVHFPHIFEEVKTFFNQDAWLSYVDNTLKEVRETDLQPLGGGVTSTLNDTISSTSSLSDEEDEFPGGKKRFDKFGQASPTSGAKPGNKVRYTANEENPSLVDELKAHQFARYFAQQLSGDRGSTSADSEDEDAWSPSRSSFASQSPLSSVSFSNLTMLKHSNVQALDSPACTDKQL